MSKIKQKCPKCGLDMRKLFVEWQERSKMFLFKKASKKWLKNDG